MLSAPSVARFGRERNENVFKARPNFLDTPDRHATLAEILFHFRSCLLCLFDDEVKGTAEDSSVKDHRSRLQCFDGRTQGLAFDQEQLTFHRFLLKLRGSP